MRRPHQTLESIQKDFDRIALISEANSSDAHYDKSVIRYIPERCDQILEIGCGTGTLSRLLAARAHKVLAIDLSEQMIRIAREHSTVFDNIQFVRGDVTTYPLPENQFDCIVTVATLHHLPIETTLRKIRKALKPGGVFVCLDLYKRSTFTDFVFDGFSYAVHPLVNLVKNGRFRPSRELREAYAQHGASDTYPSLALIQRLTSKILPGARLQRHLFWRYSIVWKRELIPLGVR